MCGSVRCVLVKIEYWGRIRQTQSGSFYLTLPKHEAYKLQKDQNSPIIGEEVKVEVTL